MTITIICSVVALVVGCILTWIGTKTFAKNQASRVIEEAKLEAEVIKQNKLLEAKEREMQIKTEAEKQANQRLQKVQL
ncbi:MAG: DUF3552 domain-containing protein, partial [Bacteroidaceae bacterium]|nr:DUF3552 domain-containing protein [Bacteroidaceae bacterium]